MGCAGPTAGERQAETSWPRPAPALRWLALGAAVLAVQAALIYGLASTPSGREWLPFLLPLAHVLLLPFLLRNLSFWGIRLILVGLLLNLAAMLANGGLMPVESPAVEAVGKQQLRDLQVGSPIPGSKNVLLNRGDIRLRELSDILVLPVPKPFTRAVSIGDLFVFTGVVIAFSEAISRNKPWKNPHHR